MPPPTPLTPAEVKAAAAQADKYPAGYGRLFIAAAHYYTHAHGGDACRRPTLDRINDNHPLAEPNVAATTLAAEPSLLEFG
jgi:hypothetical protein